MFRKYNRSIFVSLILLSAVLIAVPAAAQSCNAKVASSGVLLSFGGWDTTSVTASHPSLGYYEVTCNGLYGLSYGADSVIINSTAQSGYWGVSNAYVISASATQMVVGVYTWRSYIAEDLGDITFFLAISTN